MVFGEIKKLKESRTKVILQGLSDDIEMVGSNRDRRYKKKGDGSYGILYDLRKD